MNVIDKRFRLALAAITPFVLACAGSPITTKRIEGAIAPTFANLVTAQVSSLRLPPVTASELHVIANCRRPMAGANTGAGEWVCALDWHGPNRQTFRDAYDLVVNTDGCYTATVATESLGGPTLKTSDGREVRNLLYTIEGCFDTT